MKKTIIYLIFWIASIWILSTQVQASSSDLFLNHLDFQAQIAQDGSMKVTEKWNIKIRDTNTLYKTFKIDKNKYTSISNVEVVDITNGNEQILKKQDKWGYHLPKGNYFGGKNEDNQFEIAWGVGLEDRTATKVYRITYEVKDAIAKFSDYAELYWQFVGQDFEIDAKNITGTILLPNAVENKEEIKVWGHTEDLNGEIYVVDTNRIEFNINQFRAGRYVEVRSLFPTQMITISNRGESKERLEEVIQEETKWANDANRRREMKETTKKMVSIAVNVIAIGLSILGIKSILKNSKKIKTKEKLKPTQEIVYYREIPREDTTPAEAVALLEKQVGSMNNSIQIGRIFSATLLDLSVKKIIDFEVNEKIITIRILEENPSKLLNSEKAIFQFLKQACEKTGGQITTKELEKYIRKSASKIVKLSDKIDKETEQALYQKELADKKENEERANIIVYLTFSAIAFLFLIVIFITLMSTKMKPFGIIPLAITTLIQLIVFSILLNKINVLTQKGVNENAKWKGLKKYMQDFSMLDKREIPEVVIWEKFLVYATAFGIADKVLKQLKMVYPNIEQEFNTNHYGYMYLMLHTNFSNSFSNAITTSMSTAYSSATGGGGGFSGGGGGRTEDGGGGGGR
jgi:uncharacterized membrane protein